MSSKSKLELLAESQKNNKVVLAEVALIGLAAAFSKRFWADGSMQLNVNKSVTIDDENQKEKTNPWAQVYSTRIAPLFDKLADPEMEKYHDRLEAMGQKLVAMGGVASDAIAQVRGF